MVLEDLLRRSGDVDRVSVSRRDANLSLLGKTLTVGELMRLLTQLDPAMPVMLPFGEGGLSAALVAEPRKVELAVNSMDGFGPHEFADANGEADLTALVLMPSAVDVNDVA